MNPVQVTSVRFANAGDLAGIAGFIGKTVSATLYHDYLWMDVIRDTFGHKGYYLICEDASRTIQGVLPLVHLNSLLFGNFMVSMPYFNYGGICAEEPAVRERLLRAAIATARDAGARHLELRQQEPLGNGMPVKTKKVSMRLTLGRDAGELMKSFPSKLRSQIRAAAKRDLKARIGAQEELDGFYEVFATNMRDLGTPVYPKRFFGNILERFCGKAFIATVYLGDAPVASGFLIGYKDRMEIPWASSLRKFNPLSPNMLLYWTCLEFACGKGYDVFDFGRSSVGESTYRFKQQWGATPVQLYWHYWLGDGEQMPDLSPSNEKYRLMVRVWKRLPLAVTRTLGPRIVRSLP